MRKLNWKIAASLGAVAVIAGSAAGVAGVASADSTAKASDYVDGFGEVTDDFNDHESEVGVLCDGCDNSQGNDLVVMWQSIMFIEGLYPPDYIAAESDEMFDGYFGSVTARATEDWQEVHGLESTGEVDAATWAEAGENLYQNEEGSVNYSGGPDGNLDFSRDPETGVYRLNYVSRDAVTDFENIADDATHIRFDELKIELEQY